MGSFEIGSGCRRPSLREEPYVDPMGMRLTCCFPHGTRSLRYCGPAIHERRRASPGLRRAASGAHCHIRYHCWIGRWIKAKFVLHGVLIGVVGTLMYLGLTRVQSEPWQYLFAHALKVVGGAAGGLVLARRQTATN